jgi:hypothetical protein
MDRQEERLRYKYMNGQTYRWMEKESGRQSEEKRLIDK